MESVLMSAVKRVFKHSAIRSAIRKPFIANDDGYREYLQRSVFELNGTQWGVSSEKLDTTSANRVKVTVQFSAIYDATVPRLWSFFTDDNADYFRLQLQVVNNQWVAKVESLGQTPGNGSIVVGDGKFHKIEADCNLITGVIDIYVDGVFDYSVTHAEPERLRREFNVVTGAAYSSTSTTILGQMDGIISYLEISVDDASVKLFKFDDAESAYQRNHAVVLGSELVGELPASSIGSTWEALGDGRYRAISGGQYLSVKWPCSSGTTYLVKYDIEYLGAGGIRVTSSTDLTPWDFSSTNRTVENLVTADGTTIGFKHDNDCDFIISNISIREWSGVILQNALSEHWMQIERKRYWDYWVNLQWPNLVSYSENLTTLGWGRIRCSVINTTGVNELTTTGDDAYIYADCVPVSGVFTYTTSWRIRGVAGTLISLYLMRDGFLEPRQSSGLVLSGEWQDFEFTYTFTEEPTTTVRCRFDPAQAGTGGSIGDVYEISRAALYPDTEKIYKTTSGVAGKKLEIAQ